MIVQLATIPAGARAVDYSFTTPTFAQLLALHEGPRKYAAAVMYLSTPPSDPRKNATPSRIQTAWAAGMAVGLVAEWSGTEALGGRESGISHGVAAANQAAQLGAPPGLPLMWAADFNVKTSEQIRLATDFGFGFADMVEHVGFTMGVYGNSNIIRAMKGRSRCNWLMASKSFSEPGFENDPLVHVQQLTHGSEPTWYDPNYVHQPTTFWFPHYEPDPAPPTPIPTNPIQESDTVFTIASAPGKGSALCELVRQDDGVPRYKIKGFDVNGGPTAAVWGANPSVGKLAVDAADWDDFIAAAVQ